MNKKKKLVLISNQNNAGFRPNILPGLDINLDFGNLSTITQSGGFLDAISNQGNLGGNYTGTSPAKPAYVTGYADFDGSTDTLIGSSNTLAYLNNRSGATVFIVLAPDIVNADQRLFFVAKPTGGASTSANAIRLGLYTNASSRLLGILSTDDTTIASGITTVQSTNTLTTSLQLWTCQVNKSQNQIQVAINNGSFASSTTSAGVNFTNSNSGANHLGAQAGSFFYNGKLYMVLAYNRQLSSTETLSAQNWINQRYNIW